MGRLGFRFFSRFPFPVNNVIIEDNIHLCKYTLLSGIVYKKILKEG